jgi:predicted nucleic acid-binding protein
MSADSCVFVDSNVFLYTIDEKNPSKRDLARAWVDRLWASGDGRLSWQVLNEFYANAIRKLGATKLAARNTTETLAQWQPAGYGLGIIQRAWHWMDAAQISYWDALIVASAEAMGCQWLLSEDFQTGRKFGDITVVNPFRTSPESILPFIPPPRARKS